jgi:hypothetical protein
MNVREYNYMISYSYQTLKLQKKQKKLTIISEYTLYKSLKITIYPNKASP